MNPADPAATPGIRVVTVPYADPYVDAVLPDDVVHVGPGAGPSPRLDPGHLAAHAGGVGVVHGAPSGPGGRRSAGASPPS